MCACASRWPQKYQVPHPNVFTYDCIRVTEASRLDILRRTLRDEAWCVDHIHLKNVRVCMFHVNMSNTHGSFELLPPERDPIFLEWLVASLLPDYAPMSVDSDEEGARLLIRKRVLRLSLITPADIPADVYARYTAAVEAARVHGSQESSGVGSAAATPDRAPLAQFARAAEREERASARRRRVEEELLAAEAVAKAVHQKPPTWAEHAQLLERIAEMEIKLAAQTARHAMELEEWRTKCAQMEEAARRAEAEKTLVPGPTPLTMQWLLKQDDPTTRAYVGLPKQGLTILLYLLEACHFSEAVGFDLPWQDMVFLTLHWLKIDPLFVVLQNSFGLSSACTVHDVRHAPAYGCVDLAVHPRVPREARGPHRGAAGGGIPPRQDGR